MLKSLTRIVCLMFIFLGSTTMAQSIFPYKYTKETLPNGLTVIMIPMESPGLVAYYSVVRTGSRDEVEQGKSGFAHFFEHMMFRGTKKYPGAVYDSIITSIGAAANAYTTDDYTAYHLNFAKEDLPKVMDLESDRFQNLFYEKPAFQTEAGAVYGEYRKSITSPFSILNEKMQDLAYDVHTYKHTTIGFEADIKAMPEAYDYSKTFFQRFYRPDNVVLIITGDIDTKKVMAMVTKYYGGWAKGYEAPKITPEPPQTKERTAEISYPGKTLPIIDIAYKGDALDTNNKTYVAALLLGDLAFGESSDLYKKLVIEEQKVQFISPSIPINRDMPLFEIYSMVKKVDEINYIRDEVYKTLEEFKSKPVDEKKLNNLKKRNKYDFLMGLDTPDKVAGGMARFVALTGGIEVVDKLYKQSDTITAQDIMDAAKKYFVPEQRTVVVLKGAQ
ncbi:MAG: insulinase family protein [Ignavibacteriales bacterium]|nr:insulinase family protein [Ignavibacteriales bacterium]